MAARYATQNLNNVLTNFAWENMRSGGPSIGEQIFPVIPVAKTAFTYRIFSGKEAITDDHDDERAPGTKSSEVERSYTSDTGNCVQHGLRELVADEEKDNADSEVKPEQDAALLVMGKLRTGMEQAAITLMMNASIFTNTAAAAAKWDAGTTYIENDIRLAKLSVMKKAGVSPTHIVIAPVIAAKMAATTELRDLVKYTDSSLLIDGSLPPKLFGLQVVIPTRVQNEANPGVSTASYDFICDDFNCFVGYVENTPSLRAMSAGYAFRRKLAGQSEIAMYKYYDNDRHGTWIEGLIEQVIAEVAIGAGYVISAVDD